MSLDLQKIEALVREVDQAKLALAAEINRQIPPGSTVRFTYERQSHIGIVVAPAHKKSPQAISVKIPGGRWLTFGLLGVNIEYVQPPSTNP